MPLFFPKLRRLLRLACMVLGLALAPGSLPAAAQGTSTPEALSNRYAGPWQGVWVGPDGHAWSGNWPGDLLTPDGRAVGPEEFAHFEGTVFFIVHSTSTRDGQDWTAAWLENCHNRMNDKGFIAWNGQNDTCGNWISYYERHSGLIYPDFAYAVPVKLVLTPGSHCACHTITNQTVTGYGAKWYPHHKRRAHTKGKLIRITH